MAAEQASEEVPRGSGESVPYRVVETLLARHRPSGGERVLITAMDEAGDLLTWSAQPDRVPALGIVIEVSMRRYEDDPPPDDVSDSGRTR